MGGTGHRPVFGGDFSACAEAGDNAGLTAQSRVKKFAMDNLTAIKQDIRKLMVENLMLQIGPDEIGDDQPLFGPGSVGLDSVDALQLVVALDKTYGLKIADPEAAKQILQSVNAIAASVVKHQAAGKA